MELEEYALEAIHFRLNRLLEFATSYQADPSPGILKKLRVWSRRTRTAANVFEPYFFGTTISRVQHELKLASRVFGEARDLDVMRITVEEMSCGLPETELAAVHTLLKDFEDHRERMQPKVVLVVDELIKSKLMDTVAKLTMLTEPGLVGVSSKYLEFQFKSLAELSYSLNDVKEKEALHEMRIEAKRLRYLLELFQPLHAGIAEFDIITTALIKLQDLLGSIHDGDILEMRILREVYTHFKPLNKQQNSIGETIDVEGLYGLMSVCKDLQQSRKVNFRSLCDHWNHCSNTNVFERLRTFEN